MVDLRYIPRSDIWLFRIAGDTSLMEIRRAIRALQAEMDPTRRRRDLVVLRKARFTFPALELGALKELIRTGTRGTGTNREAYVAIVTGSAVNNRVYAAMYRRLVNAPAYHVKVFHHRAEAVRWLRLFD